MPLAESDLRPFNLDQIFAPLEEVTHIAVAVSGGSDSMALLRMVQEWALPATQIFALTVDHGLRSAAADEARQVGSWCTRFSIQHVTLKWNGAKPVTGIQAKARTARYDLMSAWCLAHDVPVLLTAHTADDQAETVYMRSARTTSVKSLAGIWPERDWNGVRIIRPLLGLGRDELRAYLKNIDQDWIDDPSNSDTQFERVRVRQALAGSSNNFGEQARVAQTTMLKVSYEAEKWCDKNLKLHETGYVTVALPLFLKQSNAVQDEILLRVIVLGGTGLVPERMERQNLIRWLVEAGGSRRSLGGLIFAKRKASTVVGREPGRIAAGPVLIPASGGIVWDNRFSIQGPAGAKVQAAGRLTGLARRKDIPAFIQAGLHAILMESGQICVPLLGIGAGASCKFVTY